MIGAELINYARRVIADWNGSPESAAAALDELADTRPRRPAGAVTDKGLVLWDGTSGKKLTDHGGITVDSLGRLVLPHGYLFEPQLARRIMTPVGLHADSAAAVTALVSNEIHFVYVGRLITEEELFNWAAVVEVTTAYVSGGVQPWAQTAIYVGLPTPNAGAELTPLATTDVSAIVNSTGTKTISHQGGPAPAGSDIWFAYGSRTNGTPFQLRALLPDPIQQGMAVTATGSGTSRLDDPYNAALLGAAVRPAWCSLWL